MPKQLALRTMTEEESAGVRQLARSRKGAARVVQRAQVIEVLLNNPTLSAAEAGRPAGYANDASGRKWVKRFKALGIAGLEAEARAGRPVTHTLEVRSRFVALAVQKPRTLGYPFEWWTVQRLPRAFQAREQLHLAASTIWEWLLAEGLEWKRRQSWFHDADQHDPQFVEKRGPSSRPT